MSACAACWYYSAMRKECRGPWLVAGRAKRRDGRSVVFEYVVSDQKFGVRRTDYSLARNLDVALCERRSVFPAKSASC